MFTRLNYNRDMMNFSPPDQTHTLAIYDKEVATELVEGDRRFRQLGSPVKSYPIPPFTKASYEMVLERKRSEFVMKHFEDDCSEIFNSL